MVINYVLGLILPNDRKKVGRKKTYLAPLPRPPWIHILRPQSIIKINIPKEEYVAHFMLVIYHFIAFVHHYCRHMMNVFNKIYPSV